MFSELKSFAYPRVSSSSEMIFPDSDLNSVGFNFLVTSPVLEYEDGDDQCDIVAPLQDKDDYELHQVITEEEEEEEEEEEVLQEGDKEDEDKYLSSVSTLKIKVPSPGHECKSEDEDDGLKTPTSLDHKIPPALQCPPAPRKPKSLPSTSTKRKSPHHPRIPLDLSSELDSYFPQAILEANLGGNKIKKVRQGTDTE